MSREKKTLIGNRKTFLLFNGVFRLPKSSDLVSFCGFRQKSGPNTYRGSIAMGHETVPLFMPLATVERRCGLVLYGLETILYPYVVLLKGVVKG